MIHRIIATLLLLASFLRAAEPTVVTLDNGLTIVVEERRSAPIVVVNLWVREGSKYEDPKELGASHYLEHLFYRGTKTRASLQNREEILAVGGKTSAATWYDWTNYYNIVPSEHFVLALDGLADGFLHATLQEKQIENERSVVGEEIRQRIDDPSTFVYEEMTVLAFAGHPYAGRVVGSHETIDRMTREGFAKYYSRYVPSNLVVVVVGDVGAEEAIAEVKERLGGGERAKPNEPPAIPKALRGGGRRTIGRADLSQAYLAGGFRIPGYRHPDRAAIEVTARLLYGRMQTRLVEGDRTASEVNAHTFMLDDLGLIGITGKPLQVQDIRKVERCCLEEVSRFRAQPPGDAEVASMVRYFRLQELFGDETAFSRAQELGHAVLNGDARYATGYAEELSRVTAADVERVAKTYLSAENYSSVTLVPDAVVSKLPADEEAQIAEVLAGMKAGTDAPEGLDLAAALYADKPAAATGSADHSGGGLPRPERKDASNGLRVLAARRPDCGVIELGIYVRAGTICDPAGKAGCAALATRWMQEGGARFDRNGFLVELNRIGGQWTVEVERDYLDARITVAPQDQAAGLGLLEDVLVHPKLEADSFGKVRDGLLAFIREENDTLATIAFKRLFDRLLCGHPYARPRNGLEEQVRGLTPDEVRAWVKQFVRPERTVAMVVGDNEPKTMTKWITGRLGRWKPEGPAGNAQTGEPTPQFGEFASHMPKEQSYGTIGVLVPPVASSDRAALTVLGETLRLRVFRNLIYEKALAYTASGWVDQLKEAGYFVLYFSTKPDRFEETLAQAKGHLDRAVEEGIPADEVASIKGRLAGGRALDLETAGDLVATWGRLEAMGLGWEDEEQARDALARVTPEEVAAAAKTYLAPDKRVTVRVTPEK